MRARRATERGFFSQAATFLLIRHDLDRRTLEVLRGSGARFLTHSDLPTVSFKVTPANRWSGAMVRIGLESGTRHSIHEKVFLTAFLSF